MIGPGILIGSLCAWSWSSVYASLWFGGAVSKHMLKPISSSADEFLHASLARAAGFFILLQTIAGGAVLWGLLRFG